MGQSVRERVHCAMKFWNSATLPVNVSGSVILGSFFLTDDLEQIDDVEELEKLEEAEGTGELGGVGVLLFSSLRVWIHSCKVRIKSCISSFCRWRIWRTLLRVTWSSGLVDALPSSRGVSLAAWVCLGGICFDLLLVLVLELSKCKGLVKLKCKL